MRVMRSALAAAAVVALAGASVVAGAASAGAAQRVTAVSQTTCKLTGSATFSPGLTTVGKAQTDTVKSGVLSSCVGGGVTGATFSGTLKSAKQTCSAGTASGKLALKWNTGVTSTATVKLSPGKVQLTAVVSGTITAGKFLGDVVSAGVTLTPGAGQNCILTPVTSGTLAGTGAKF